MPLGAIPFDVKLACAVPECRAEVAQRVPVEEDVPGASMVDGKWWLPLCADHAKALLGAESTKETK